MKKYFIALFILPLLLIACEEEGPLPAMPPYIFFNNDVNTYVIDPNDFSLTDDPEAKVDTIIGRIYAQQKFYSFVMGESTLTSDILGDSISRIFKLAVPLEGKKEDFDISFMVTDQVGNTVSTPFHYLMAKPVDTYTVTMGAQYNPYLGFFFSFEDKQVYTVSEMKSMKNPQGFCFGYNIGKKEILFVSPSDLILQNILPDYKAGYITSFVSVSAVKGKAITKSVFDNMTNDALMRNLNMIEYGTFSTATVNEGMAYLFKNEDDSVRGMMFVESLTSGVGGKVTLTIKMMK
ncbi:hypothetical protein [Bacteroides sp.]|uniref:hypothetical protein n=1 Tax=Bacteroides sp. TaxID=29523 RepID=UPI002616670E|nr:hypothetical protein [Bacteroides sp.]